jgi:hypothetical protein
MRKPISLTAGISALTGSRSLLAGLVILTLAIFLGCMSLSIGGRTYEAGSNDLTSEAEMLVQGGDVRVRPHGEQTVYYPIPYAHAPNLNLGEEADDCTILEQKEDCFRVRNTSFFAATIHWKARGMKVPPPAPPEALPAAPIPNAAVGPVPSTTLPPEPVKIP